MAEKQQPNESYQWALKAIREAKEKRLTELAFSRPIIVLPPEIGELTDLCMLDLSGSGLTSLPESLGHLTALQSLQLRENNLTELPESLGQLAALQSLRLWGNKLTKVPAWLGQLTALRLLNLGGNKLTELPESLGQLTALQSLYLWRNNLTKLPESLGQLTALQLLDLSDNNLANLPESLIQLRSLTSLYLHGNQSLAIPPEVLGPTHEEVSPWAPPASPQAILQYYFRARSAAGRRSLNEVKVVLVGQGSVGKTSLVKRIVYGTFNKRERKTDGIYINKEWHVPGKAGKGQVQVNFWDFGGQEIMHATHQFFLTQRTVYVLVLDARKGENESNIHYWLKMIRSYAGDSPILVVTNKCEAHFLELNESRLRKDYPNIRGFLRTSCETGKGVAQLKTAIATQIRAMRHVFDPLPIAYFRIKEDLEAVAQRRNYLPLDDYREACSRHSVTSAKEQDHLLRFLHDLGSVLCFNDPDSPYTLREMSVLNPEWVTKGVYKILNNATVAKRGGVLLLADLPKILPSSTHPKPCHGFIIEMMKKFELCFAIEEDRKWLVAELLHVDEPEVNWDYHLSLNFQYRYEVLPPGIICRFIVRRYQDLTPKPTYWRSGVILQLEGCKMLVRSDTDKGRMFISVTGPDARRRSALAVIRDEFRRIHSTVPRLEPREMVPLPDDLDAEPVPYDHLCVLEDKGVAQFIPQGTRDEYEVARLLNGIEDPRSRRRQKDSMLRDVWRSEVFISYSHKDKSWLDRLKTMLAPLVRDESLKLWDDTRLAPGQKWQEEIRHALARAKIGVLLVSPDFLASDFIAQNELPPLLTAAEDEGLTIFWVPVRAAMYETTPIAEFQAACDPGRPLAGLSEAEVDEALKAVAERLKRAYDGS